MLAAINWAPDVDAYLGGVAVGLAVLFTALLLTLGVGVIRRFFSG